MIRLEMYVLTLKVNPNGNTLTVLITAPFSTALFYVKLKKKLKTFFKHKIKTRYLLAFLLLYSLR